MEPEKRYRYPGINFFTKEDQDIFCGRADDADRLFTRIMNNNTMILHGESGIGKSSLVQAGILPLLEKRNKDLAAQHKPQYLPVTIRFDSLSKLSSKDKGEIADDDELLIRQTLYKMYEQSGYQAKDLPYISPKDNDLWYAAKLFEKSNHTFLLIFDQFEEFQGYNYRETEVFAHKLSELFLSTMPPLIYKEYDKKTAALLNDKELTDEGRREFNENIKFMERPLSVRILFVIREDRLGTMSLLADYFPDILKNNFFLLPLDKTGATRAIVEPAQVEGNFVSGKFTFEDLAVKNLMENLVDVNTNLYDPFQLQIVCGSIEKKIAITKREVTAGDIPKIGDIISDFYNDIWNKIQSDFKLPDEDFEKKRIAIIGELVVGGRRNLVLENKLLENGNNLDKNIVGSLLSKGLLKKIPSGRDTFFYQLSHDRLMEPLAKDLLELEAKENLRVKYKERKAINQSGRKLVMLLLGIISISFPFIAFISNSIHLESISPPDSIIAGEFYGPSGDILMSMRYMLGLCFILYKGYKKIDSILAKLVTFLAIVDVLITDNINMPAMHLLTVFLSLLVAASFPLFLFRKTNAAKIPTRQKKLRNKIYFVCGISMVICNIILYSAWAFGESGLLNNRYHVGFWIETLLFFSLGFPWVIKSGRVLEDNYLY